jgi:hypothetical protein
MNGHPSLEPGEITVNGDACGAPGVTWAPIRWMARRSTPRDRNPLLLSGLLASVKRSFYGHSRTARLLVRP